MALNPQMLTRQIQAVFDQRLEENAKIAQRIANAYQQYAVLAQAPPAAPVILGGAGRSRFLENALRALMERQFPAGQAAQVIANGIRGFWLTPPVTTGIGGVCTAIAPGAAVGKMSATRVDSAGGAAASLARSLDMMTKTVFVTNPSPIPPGFLF